MRAKGPLPFGIPLCIPISGLYLRPFGISFGTHFGLRSALEFHWAIGMRKCINVFGTLDRASLRFGGGPPGGADHFLYIVRLMATKLDPLEIYGLGKLLDKLGLGLVVRGSRSGLYPSPGASLWRTQRIPTRCRSEIVSGPFYFAPV